ncbi:hypothetical protein UlMin_013022 [Ulmus minor]
MAQPPGFETKEASHMGTLFHMGFSSSKADNSLFLKFSATSTIFLLVYVDDIIVVGSQKLELDSFISVLNKLFSLKDLGELNYFLGIEVQSIEKGLHLSQKKYICDLLKRSKMDQANPLPTPMISTLKLTATNGDPVPNITEYRSIKPLDHHWKAVKRILRYLKGTADEGITLRKTNNMSLIGYCDADWGNDLDNRRSTTGYCIFLGDSLVSWSSKKQSVVSRSTTEAEYGSLANATSEIVWLQSLLSELRVDVKTTPVL